MTQTSSTKHGSRRSALSIMAAALFMPAVTRQSALAQQAGGFVASASLTCDVPDHIIQFNFPLSRLSQKLQNREPICIVCCGSSSTQGVGASEPAKTYPFLMEQSLQQAFPNSQISVINTGVGGRVVAQVFETLDEEVLSHKPDLVIWQAGSNEIMAGKAFDTFASDLMVGIQRIKNLGIDIIVVGPQNAPAVTDRKNAKKTIKKMADMATSMGINFVNRFEITRFWARKNGITPDVLLGADKLHNNDEGYRCMAAWIGAPIRNIVQATSNRALQP